MGTVVATDTASVDADYDNGTVVLYGVPRYQECGKGQAHRLTVAPREAPEKEAQTGTTWLGRASLLRLFRLGNSADLAHQA
jgi:hypothetical protein